jgi:tetratricopeptide (TPR) repeat protein
MFWKFLRDKYPLLVVVVGVSLFVGVNLRYAKIKEAEAHFELFTNQFKDGKYTEAQINIDKAITLSPKRALYLAHQALLHERMLKYEFGVADFLSGKLDLDDEDKRHIITAVSSYQQALNLNPNDDCYYHNLGWLYHLLRDEQKALDCFRRAVAIDPSNALYHISLGLFSEYSGRASEAYNEYAQAIRISPSILDSQFFRDLQTRSPTEADGIVTRNISYLESALSEKDDPILKGRLGKHYLHKQLIDKALKLLKQSSAELPSLSRVWFNLGYAYEQQGNETEMRRCYEKASLLDGSDFLPQLRLGELHYNQVSSRRMALIYYKRAVDNRVNLMSDHARRASRVYKNQSTVPDDVVPGGLLSYCTPDADMLSACVRLSALYLSIEEKELSDHYENLCKKF